LTALKLDKVSRRFGGVEAAVGVTLEIPQGKIIGLIGPNGAGKSTIVNLITGVLRLDSGTVTVGDTDITASSIVDVSRAGVCRTFQNGRLLREASVLDNVAIGFHQHERASLWQALVGAPAARAEQRDLEERARKLLAQAGMMAFADLPAAGLSYGHRRRVEMLRAVATAPRFLLLDEPVAGMNDVEAAELGEVFLELAAKGIGILLIEHNMRFVTSVCSHIYVLNTGRIIASGAPADVTRNPDVIAAYLGS
jgi:branched-chain amino acid transport system ATP-binding protein